MAKLVLGFRCYMCKTCGRIVPDSYRCWLHYKATAHNEFWGPDGEAYIPTTDPQFIDSLQVLDLA